MWVRITAAFLDTYQVFNPGQELEVPNKRGAQYLKRGLAERIDDPTAPAADSGSQAETRPNQ